MGIPTTASHPHRRSASTTHGPHRRATIHACGTANRCRRPL